MTAVITAELLDYPKCFLGESPRWCERTQALSYIDIALKKLFVLQPSKEQATSMDFDQFVGFAQPSSSCDGSLSYLVGLEDRVVEVDAGRQRVLREVCRVPAQYVREGTRFNDAETSPSGTLYAGYMSNRFREGEVGQYFRITPEGVRDLLPLGLPNGAAWRDESTLYVVDSHAGEVLQVEVHGEGVRGRRAVYRLLPEHWPSGAILDGMAMDQLGRLWVAVSGGGCVLCIDPATSSEVYRLHVPCSKPTACAFGGQQLDLLYITSRNEAPDERGAQGGLYVARAPEGVRGMRAAVPACIII